MPKTKSHVRLKDDGPKLREEKHYKDFYPDLDHQESLPLILGEDVDQNGDDRQITHIKQLIFNNKITLEHINSNVNKSRFKKCKITVSELNGAYKVPRQYHKFGYRSHSSSAKVDHLTTPYLKKTDDVSNFSENTLSTISKYQKKFKVEYDMDEQDELYIQFLNENRLSNTRNLLRHEIFEIVMTVLENEWFYLEKKIPPRTSTNPTVSTHESHAAWVHYELYGSDDGTGYTTDQPCAVCGVAECDNSNAIVFCDGCDVAVHQECYGVVFIPEGQWLCRRCMISKNRKINCLFCPSHTGAFKQTDTGSWGHVLCGVWIPELFFANLNYMEPIEGVDLIPRNRWKLNCYICRQKMGACIQCANKNCFTAYHVTCAKRAGLYMDFGGCSILEIVSNNFPRDNSLQSFCDKHSPPSWGDCQQGISKTRRYFENIQQIISGEQKKQQEPPNSVDSSKNKWKTNRGTPIAPQMFAAVVQKVLQLFQIANSEKLSIDLCKYWSMKRELKRGAPLVRNFDPTSFNTLNVEEIQRRIEFAEVLLNDLNKLHELSSLLVKRQRAAMLHNSALQKSYELVQNPANYLIQTVVLDKLLKTEAFKMLLKILEKEDSSSVSSLLAKCSDGQYTNIQSFKADMSLFFKNLQDNIEIPRYVQSAVLKVSKEFDRLISKIDDIDPEKLLSRDFVIKDTSIEEVPWKGPVLMKEEELSDVEDLSQFDKRRLKSLLK